MASNRETIEETDNLMDENESIIDEYAPAKLSEQLLQAYNDDDVNLTISRKMKGGRKTAFLFEVDEYDDLPSLQTKLRDEYGGGSFFIEGRKHGKWVLKQELNIEPPHKETVNNEANNSNDINSLILAMQENARRDAELMREQMLAVNENIRLSQIEAAKSQNEMLLRMMEINTNKDTAPQTSPMDIMALVVQMQELTANKSDNIEVLLKGLELGKELSGNAGDESILQTALKTIGKPLSDMATQISNAQSPENYRLTGNQVTHNPENIKNRGVQGEVGHTNNQETNEMKILRLKPIMEMAIKGAQLDGDPETYAELIVDQLDNNLLAEYILNENNYLKLFQFAPQIKQYKVWFDNVRNIIIQWMDEAGKNQDNDENESNNIHGIAPEHVSNEPDHGEQQTTVPNGAGDIFELEQESDPTDIPDSGPSSVT